MRILVFASVVALCATAASAHVLPRPDRPRPSVFVRVMPEAGMRLDRTVLAQAIAWSHDIWRPLADVTFGTDDDIRAASSMVTLTVILTDRATTFDEAETASSLGWIEFVNDRPASTLTVSVSAARALVAATQWQGRAITTYPAMVVNQFLSRAIGRAIAHEVGHFLLASKQHTRTGLMRGRFTGADLVRADHTMDFLEAEEIARLRGRLLERAEAAPPAGTAPRRPTS